MYDISNLKIHFNTKSNPIQQVICLADFDFSSATNSLVSDIKNIRFIEYSASTNLLLINKVFDSLDMLKGIPKEIREISSNYPDSTIFNEKSR